MPPDLNHVQYRLTETPGGTLLSLIHKATCLIAPGLEADVSGGWQEMLDAIRTAAEKAAG